MTTSLLTPDDIRAALRPKAQPRLLLANVRAALVLAEKGGQHSAQLMWWRSITRLSAADAQQWIDHVWHGGSVQGRSGMPVLLALPDMQRRAQQRAKSRDRMRAKRAMSKESGKQ